MGLLSCVTIITCATLALARTDVDPASRHHWDRRDSGSSGASIFTNFTVRGCRQLSAALPQQAFPVGSAGYIAEQDENQNWSQSCVQTPQCLLEPSTAEELSTAIKSLVSSNTKFAVRSGGHMPVPGTNSITNGVLITMSAFDTLSLSDDHTIVSLGAGLRWQEVYSFLAPYSLITPGGRYGHVGVSGLLLGGGINYFGNTIGWSMNSVVNYEVVLANGTIVNANEKINKALWWALKGGSSNFGIVTRFDMKTYPSAEVYGGLSVFPDSALDAFADACVNFMNPNGGGISDAPTTIDPSIGINPSTGTLSLFGIFFRNGSDPAPRSLANFSALPVSISTLGVRPDFNTFATDGSSDLFNDRSLRRTFYTIGMKATPETARIAYNTFMSGARALTVDASLFLTYQPISKSWITAAKQKGGDAFDLNPSNGNLMALEFSASWARAADDYKVLSFFRKTAANITSQAKKLGMGYDFEYLNDAATGQNPFPTYGGGKSLPKLQKIAKDFDSKGVYQKLMPGGFKLFK
ncbi:hypothetical protein E4T39_04194 [Aureobasidium subglaciale]|nr:hypothetical protein E4T39_04194 [Aureobasidium subglaciale]